MSKKKEEPINRFARKYIVDAKGCHVWTGSISDRGYGRFWAGRVNGYAHRFIYEHATGKKIAAGLQIDHLCRNTRCVNVAHLEPVTRSENLRREAEANRCAA